MVTYGPWIQNPLYTEFTTVNTNRPEWYTQTIAEGEFETPYQDPAYPITDVNITEMFEGTQLNLGGGNWGGFIEWLSSSYNLSFPNWKSEWGAKIWRRMMHIGGREHVYNPPNQGFLPPEGAIGIDYETQPYTPETAWFGALGDVQTFHLGAESFYEGRFEDARVLPGDPLPWTVSTTLYITVPGQPKTAIAVVDSPTHDTSNNWATKNFPAAIDLAPFGATESDTWTADLHTETIEPVIGGDPAPFNDTYTQYGWLLQSLRLTQTIRPPLYRWVYANDPYRRIFPRDDGLAGGARRNYPPSKGIQSGNRNIGGYL